ncbi:MAG TPA: AI-2E family transporter [Longimicrobiaceae bacterium]|nr:AI-2E family transporter [Longimicrobiaceae bacterium]
MMLSTMLRRLPLMHLLIGACLVILAAGVRAGAQVLNPVLMAVFLAVLLGPITSALQRRRIPAGVAVTLVILVVVATGLVGVGFLVQSLREVATQLPTYGVRLNQQLEALRGTLAERNIALPDVDAMLRSRDAARIALNSVGAVLGALGSLSLTLFIFAFVLGGTAKMEHEAAMHTGSKTVFTLRFLAFAEKMRRYMAVRTVLGLVASAADYLLLLALGVEHALLWAVFSFLLSFVPNIGFTLSVIPPTAMALLGLGWRPALLVMIGYVVINNLVDNVIGPRYVGSEMKMSALLSFLSVIFWAWVLGPTGAVLAVPLTVFIRDVAMGMDDEPPLIVAPSDESSTVIADPPRPPPAPASA